MFLFCFLFNYISNYISSSLYYIWFITQYHQIFLMSPNYSSVPTLCSIIDKCLTRFWLYFLEYAQCDTRNNCLEILTVRLLERLFHTISSEFSDVAELIISPVSEGSGDVMVLRRSRPPPAARNGVNAITQKPRDGLFSNLVYTLVVIVSWPD